MKTVKCLTRLPIIDRQRWLYPLKEFAGIISYFSSEHVYTIAEHKIPDFLSVHAHLSIEHVIEASWNLFAQFPFKRLLFGYDVLHGLICVFKMKEILEWWRTR
ncbi:hypothetical protein MUP77_16370 [Candidatus Bathyarchaeota archaeon]|nr:hypothetical protein [Candidatus Bathyarchaeota archaeon]